MSTKHPTVQESADKGPTLDFDVVPRSWIEADYQGPLMVPVAERAVKAFRAVRAAHDEDTDEIVVRYIEMDWGNVVVERRFDVDDDATRPVCDEWQCGFLADVDELDAAGRLEDSTDADRAAWEDVKETLAELTADEEVSA